MYQKILIPLQDKKSDESVLVYAEKLATQIEATLTLLRVIAIADDGGESLGRQFQLEVGSSGWRRKNRAEKSLARLERQLRAQGLAVDTALVIGSRSEEDEIVSYASEHSYDLILMSRETYPWYVRWIKGNLVGGVLSKSNVPTLFVGEGRLPVKVARQEPEANKVMAFLGRIDM